MQSLCEHYTYVYCTRLNIIVILRWRIKQLYMAYDTSSTAFS